VRDGWRGDAPSLMEKHPIALVHLRTCVLMWVGRSRAPVMKGESEILPSVLAGLLGTAVLLHTNNVLL
jgi:hypothetical protein